MGCGLGRSCQPCVSGLLVSFFLTLLGSHRNLPLFLTVNFLFFSGKGYASYIFSLDTQYPLPSLFLYCSYNFVYFSLVYNLYFYSPQNSLRAS